MGEVTRLPVGDAADDESRRGFSIGDRDLSQPPNNFQAEQAVIGSVLLDPRSLVNVADFLTPEDFYDSRHRHIYAAMLSLQNDQQAIDYHTIADRLTQMGRYEMSGGLLYLSEISLATPTAAFIESYGEIVERTSIMRQLISKAQSISEIAYRDNLAADAALEKAAQLIAGVSGKRQTKSFEPLETVLSEYMDQIISAHDGEQAVRYGIPSGFTDIDRILTGFKRTDLIVLAARTSVGKTSFAMALAVNAAVKSNATVGILSLEMSSEQLAARLLSMQSGVDAPRIQSAELNEHESRKLDAALNVLVNARIWVDDVATQQIGALCAKARRLAASNGLDMLIIDYLQLISGNGGTQNRVQEVGQITKALKQLAKELNIPIIALCQLSRAVESRMDHMPILSDLRDSGDIEQDADVVLFLYRDEKYNPDTDKKGICDVIIAKHRNGPTGQAQLLFLERSTKFLDLEVYRS